MYEQNARWNSFYRETDPARRRTMLTELMKTEPDDGANMYRYALLDARHGAKKHEQGEIDRYLFQFVNMVQVYRSARIFRKSAAREILKTMRELKWSDAPLYGEAGERALYWELRNAAARFFKTCESPQFNRSLFGMVASGDAGRQNRVCEEVWQMTRGLSERTGLHDELRIWNAAVTDAYCQFDGGAMERLAAYKPRK